MTDKNQASLAEELPRNVELESALQYGGENPSSLYADARRQLYKYAEDGRDIWTEIVRVASNEGPGIVLDVATGSAPVINKLVEGRYQGSIWGLDINAAHFQIAEELLSADYPAADIHFVEGSATKLPFEDNSVDTLIESFLRYHLSDAEQEAALAEYRRVLKPQGLLIVSSRDEENHERLWRLAGHIADRCGALKPMSFYPNCNLKKTEVQLSKLFSLDQLATFRQDCDLRIPMEGLPDVRLALQSLRPLMIIQEGIGPELPSGAEIDRLIDTDIRRIFEIDIYGIPGVPGRGYFKDRVTQGFFCARNIK